MMKVEQLAQIVESVFEPGTLDPVFLYYYSIPPYCKTNVIFSCSHFNLIFKFQKQYVIVLTNLNSARVCKIEIITLFILLNSVPQSEQLLIGW